MSIAGLSWPASEAGRALRLLARPGGIRAADDGSLPERNGEALAEWIDDVAHWVGVEVEGVTTDYAGVERTLRTFAPGIIRLPSAEGDRLLVVARAAGRNGLRLIDAELQERTVSVGAVAAALRRPLVETHREGVDEHVLAIEVGPARAEAIRDALMETMAEDQPLPVGWLLRPSPHRPLRERLIREGLIGRTSLLLAVHAGHYGLWVAAWWVLGVGALHGQLDVGLLSAWLMLLATSVPLQVWASWTRARLMLDWGAAIKQQLMTGALALDPHTTRMQGVGTVLGRVVESEAVEAAAHGGGLTALIALVEIGVGGWVLSNGTAGTLLALVLSTWLCLVAVVTIRHHRKRSTWTAERRRLTGTLVEQMLGHRTRLVQQSAKSWHRGEDPTLSRYLQTSAALDGSGARLAAVMPRGWVLVSLLVVLASFSFGSTSLPSMAISLGGILLVHRALEQLVGGLESIVAALVALDEIRPLLDAAVSAPSVGVPIASELLSRGGCDTPRPMLEARGVGFRHLSGGRPTLESLDFTIFDGDRVLLEGPSGSGKSTLGALLVGLREVGTGTLLLQGLDRATLGTRGWRRRAVAAPAFHENRVIAAPFAFNLLMGRAWPPREEDLHAAYYLCHELGLGPLLERMPGGMMQMVGESGWQLSHGERSRLYLARALLQGAELVVLDESFAALDPENLERSLQTVMNRAPTLVVIAHP